jgi:hypothetical protein
VANGAGAGRFLWDDYFGLFAKAEGEMASLQAAMDPDVMFNFLCSVTHVSDWIMHDPGMQGLPPQAAEDAEKLAKDPAVHAIRELCNGAKHLNLDRPKRSPPPVVRTARHWFERPFANLRRSPWLPRDETETKYLVDVNGQPRDVLDLGHEVLTVWRRFLESYQLPVPP